MTSFAELGLPGADLVDQGLVDLQEHRQTDAALLVLIASPRLRDLGIEVPERNFPQPYEHQLYSRLEERYGTGAHSQYNSLIRRMVSFARALESVKIRNPKLEIRNKFKIRN